MNLKCKRTLMPKLRFPEFRDSGNWNAQRLGSFTTVTKGKGISKADLVPYGKQPCIRYGELYTYYGEVIEKVIAHTNANADDLVLSRKQDVIMPSSGETKIDIAKASCVMLDDVALGSDLNILRSHLYGPFFSYYLNGSKRFGIAKVAQGDTVAHLYPSQLEKVEIKYPSLPEQQKIADCLSSLDGLIAAEDRMLEALKAHKKGLMQQLFPGTPTFSSAGGESAGAPSQPRLRFPEFRDKGEWVEKPLVELVKFASGGTPSKNDPKFWDGDIPWISASAMHDTAIYDSELRVTQKAIGNGTRLAEKGSILILVRGSMLFKRVPICIAERDVAFNQDVKSIRPKRGVVTRYLLNHLIASESRIPINPTGIGAGKIDMEHLKSLLIGVPSSAEQQKIADCLTALDAQITAQAAKIDALRQHKRGLMQQLFPAPEEVEV